LIASGTFHPDTQLRFFRKNFRTLKDTLTEAGVYKGVPCIDSILFDLGISSYEIDESGRGFTFQKDEPLSMTFGTSSEYPFTAYEIVNTWDEKTIADIIYAYGEDTYAKRIAKVIVEEREARKKAVAYESKDKQSIEEGIRQRTIGICTSKDLAELIKKAYPVHARFGRTHPATKTFQALRIAVNDELRSIQEALPQALELLKPGGRLAVISFHSLEDRIVKQFFKEKMGGTSDEVDEVYGGYKPSGVAEVKAITKKPITPSEHEISENPRSRSSKLRIVEKL
jgi:16S rRNA (cytosine1402-N4)-methyltransferase